MLRLPLPNPKNWVRFVESKACPGRDLGGGHQADLGKCGLKILIRTINRLYGLMIITHLGPAGKAGCQLKNCVRFKV
jgi:hypothetical protein